MDIKKICLSSTLVCTSILGIGYFSLKTPSGENEIYSYLKNGENEIISVNDVNEVITLLRKTKDAKNLENIQFGTKFIKKILITRKDNTNIYNLKEDIFFIETKVSDRIIKYFLEKNNKIQKVSESVYSFNDKNELYYLLIDRGNILASKDKGYIENLVKNKQENRNKELIERIKTYDDKTIASVMLNNNNSLVKKYVKSIEREENYIEIDGDKIDFSFNFYPSAEELAKFRNDYFSKNGNDGLFGEKVYLKNNLYVRTTNSDVGLISYVIPKLKVNDKGENDKNNPESIKVDIKQNEFLYGKFEAEEGISLETQGYLTDKNIELKIITDEKTFVTFYDKGKDFSLKTLTKKIGF